MCTSDPCVQVIPFLCVQVIPLPGGEGLTWPPVEFDQDIYTPFIYRSNGNSSLTKERHLQMVVFLGSYVRLPEFFFVCLE